MSLPTKIILNKKEEEKVKSCEEKTTVEEFRIPVVRLTRARVASLRSTTPVSQSVGAESEQEGDESDCSIYSVPMAPEANENRERTSSAADSIFADEILVLDEDDEVLNPLVTPTSTRSKRRLPTVEELRIGMREQPTDDLGSRIMESLAVIDKVTDKSRNLQGKMVHAIRVSVLTVQAAATEVLQRVSSEHLEQQNTLLRWELAALNKKVEVLTTELDQLRRRSTETDKVQPKPSDTGLQRPDIALMDKIGELVESKLASFKAELFSERTVRPPLGKKDSHPVVAKEDEPKRTSARKRKGVKGANIRSAPTVTDLPPVPAPTSTSSSIATRPPTEIWAKVTSRKTKTKAPTEPVASSNLKKGAQKKAKLPRVPKSAAISITVPKEAKVTYAQVMETAKQQIKLTELGITDIRPKKAINGGLLLEISGADSVTKADALAGRMKEAVAEMGAKISRPQKMGEARVMDLDDSVTAEEVTQAIAESCGCAVDEVRVGEIRKTPSSLGTVWVRCPLAAIRKLATAKRVRVGWVSARVEVLAARPLQCFRCLEQGHARHHCTSTVDRSGLCYVCGEPDHKASHCKAQAPKCALCLSYGLPNNHRLGSKRCSPPKAKKGKGKKWGSLATATETGGGPAQPSAENHRPTEEKEMDPQ